MFIALLEFWLAI